jgi:hypothetical protein
MSKTLILAGLIIASLVTLISVGTNYQSADIPLKDDRVNNTSVSKNEKLAWKTILLTASQYQSPVTKSANQVTSKQVTEINDSTVVGIVLDEPSSVLLIIEGDNDVKSFKIGDGWLENWVVESLQADSINWLNTENQQTYVQPLFDLTLSETATNKKVNKKRNGKRK